MISFKVFSLLYNNEKLQQQKQKTQHKIKLNTALPKGTTGYIARSTISEK